MSTAPLAATEAPLDNKKAEALAFLSEFFQQLQRPVDFECVDLSDGTLGVNVKTEPEFFEASKGQRGQVLESLQFLVNKSVNKSGVRRWVTLGLNATPVPRGAKKPVAAVPAVPHSAPAASSNTAARKPRGAPSPQDVSVAIEPDTVMSPLGTLLAQKSAKFGRVYAVLNLSHEDRARMLQTGQAVTGQRTRVEGDGHFRRLVFQPNTLAALPKRAPMPDYDEEE